VNDIKVLFTLPTEVIFMPCVWMK